MKAATRSRTFFSAPLLAGLFVGLVLLCQAMLAQAQPGDADPPARAARVGEVVGDAWVYDGENREWIRVLRNQTLGEGDRLRTDERSRVALRIGSTSVWVDERSDLSFDQLDEGRTQILLERGDIGLRLRAGGDAPADTHVRTREGELVPERDGLYRVEQLDNDSGTRAYVWQGRLRFDPARGDGDIPPTILQGGEQAEFWWAGGPRVERQRLQSDGFGDWIAAQREPDYTVAQRYVSPEMTGIEDLDRNGRWEQASDYGPLWIPTAVAPGWAPYRDGNWVWSRNWGWTWVDDAPWGFAPFHYGRWVMWGGRWCWAPGSYVRRPVYAPALVGWVGGGSISIGINVGRGAPPPRYGWYPLAPREHYVPPYRHSPVYVDRINNGRDDRGRGRDGRDRRPPPSNLHVPGAVSFLPGQGGPVRALPRDEAGKLRPTPVPGIAPGRQEFARVLPQRPPQEVRTPAQMPVWRGNDRAGRDDRRDERRDDRRDERRPDRGTELPRHDPRDRNVNKGDDVVRPPQLAVPQVQQPQPPQGRTGGPEGVREREESMRQQRDQQERQQREQQQRAQQQEQRAQQERQQQEQQQRARNEQQQQQQQQRQQQAERERQQHEMQQQQQQRQQQERAAQEQQQRQQQDRAQQQEQRQQQQERAQQQQEQRARNEQRQQQQEQQQRAQQQQQQAQQQQQPQRREGPANGNGNRRGNDDGDRGERRGRQPQQQER